MQTSSSDGSVLDATLPSRFLSPLLNLVQKITTCISVFYRDAYSGQREFRLLMWTSQNRRKEKEEETLWTHPSLSPPLWNFAALVTGSRIMWSQRYQESLQISVLMFLHESFLLQFTFRVQQQFGMWRVNRGKKWGALPYSGKRLNRNFVYRSGGVFRRTDRAHIWNSNTDICRETSVKYKNISRDCLVV